MKTKISIGVYNILYNDVETALSMAFENLGLSDEEFNLLANKNEQISVNKKETVLPNSYYVYKLSANYAVDKILETLNIEVEEDVEPHENF